MAQDTRQPRDEQPNHASTMEQPEGARENTTSSNERQQGAGVTNRPIEEEREEQESLPPRGTAKDDSHA